MRKPFKPTDVNLMYYENLVTALQGCVWVPTSKDILDKLYYTHNMSFHTTSVFDMGKKKEILLSMAFR